MIKKYSILRDAFGKALLDEAKKNKRIVSISIDLKSACKLDYMFNKLPDRSFEIGIAEGNAIGIAVGLSFEKFRPFFSELWFIY